jgi:high-affinity nickel permease
VNILLFFTAATTFATLVFGFLLGLKHATEADHLAAVSTIVTERRSLFASALVGGLWGLGHTISLFIAGVFVLLLHFEINEKTETALEFCVGIMLFFARAERAAKIIAGRHAAFSYP